MKRISTVPYCTKIIVETPDGERDVMTVSDYIASHIMFENARVFYAVEKKVEFDITHLARVIEEAAIDFSQTEGWYEDMMTLVRHDEDAKRFIRHLNQLAAKNREYEPGEEITNGYEPGTGRWIG